MYLFFALTDLFLKGGRNKGKVFTYPIMNVFITSDSAALCY